MTKSARALTNFISGGAGYLIPMAINLWSMPYVFNKLGEEAYGIQVLGNVIIGYFMAIDMGIDIPIIKRVAETDASGLFQEQSDFLQATAKIYFFIGLSGCVLILISTPLMINWFSMSDSMLEEGKVVFYLSGIGFLGSIFSIWGKAVYSGLHRYDISNGINITSSIVGILLGLLLIHSGYGVIGFFSARVSGFIVSSLVYVHLVSKRIIKFNLNHYFEKAVWNSIKSQTGYGFLLRMSGLIFSRIDQVLIASWIGVESVAVYSIPILIVTTLSGLVASSTHFLFPAASALKVNTTKQEIEAFFVQSIRLVGVLCTLSFLPFIIWGKWFISLWISPSMAAQCGDLMFYLAISFYLTASITIGLNAFLAGLGNIKLITVGNLTKSLGLFIGFLFAIKPFGLKGASFVYLVANIIDIVYMIWIIEKYFNMKFYSLFSQVYLKLIILAIALGSAMFLFSNKLHTWFGLISALFLFGIAFVSGALLLGLFSKREKDLVIGIITKSFSNS